MEEPARPRFTGYCVITGRKHVDEECKFDHAALPIADDVCAICHSEVNEDAPDDPLRRMCGVCCDCSGALHLTCQMFWIRQKNTQCHMCRRILPFNEPPRVPTPPRAESPAESEQDDEPEDHMPPPIYVARTGYMHVVEPTNYNQWERYNNYDDPEFRALYFARLFIVLFGRFYPSHDILLCVRNVQQRVDRWCEDRPPFGGVANQILLMDNFIYIKFYALEHYFNRHPFSAPIEVATLMLWGVLQFVVVVCLLIAWFRFAILQ